MLSRVLPQAEDEAQPVAWRSGASGAPAPRSKSPAAPPGPQAPSATFEAQVHQQLEAAFEAGLREGEAARKKLEGEVRRAVEHLAQVATEVTASRADALRRAEADIVQLSIEIARRILHRELSVDPGALGALIRAALDKLVGQQVCRVRVHPDQEQLVRKCLAELGRAGDVEVLSDTTQSRNGALFETDSGFMDASVETQLREIERGLADRLQERT